MKLVQSNQIWSVSFDNLARGIFEPVLVAGSGRGVEKDGSGKSSSFLNPSCISNYQKSIIVGTGAGQVKIISEVLEVAEFLENTFVIGVEGFGLHKKAGKINENANLETCQVAHEKMGNYLEKVTENIKDNFKC